MRAPAHRIFSLQHKQNVPWLKSSNRAHGEMGIRDTSTIIQGRNTYLVPLRGGADEFPFISVTAMLTGFSLISRFLIYENKIYSSYRKSTSLGERVSWADYVQYRMDHYFSVTSWTKPLLLMSIAFVLIFISTCVRFIFLREDFGTAAWSAWTFVADAGTHAESTGRIGQMIGFVTTLGGMLVFGLMIGVISDFFSLQLDTLKKGKSTVLESGHSLILGWGDKTLDIIRELALANESNGGGTIVVMSEHDKENMEEAFQMAVSSKDQPLLLRGSRCIFRTGNPVAEYDLRKVSAGKARSIILLTPEGMSPDAADARMIRIILAIKQRQLSEGSLCGHIVAELQDIDNEPLARLAGGDDVEIVVSHDRIGSVMLLTARSPWLAMVGFDGNEFYFKEWPELVGLTFEAVSYRFDHAIVVGLQEAGSRRIMLNPPPETMIKPGDRVLVLAEDDSTYCPNKRKVAPVRQHLVPSSQVYSTERSYIRTAVRQQERLLFIGWRRDMADMIRELDYDVPPGSELWLLNREPINEREQKLLDKGNKEPLALANLKLRHVLGNPVVRRDLQLLEESGMDENNQVKLTGLRVTLDYFTSILILSEGCTDGDGKVDIETMDSRTIATKLLTLDIQSTLAKQRTLVARMAAKRAGSPPPPPPPPPPISVSEIHDIRTRNLFVSWFNRGLKSASSIDSKVLAGIGDYDVSSRDPMCFILSSYLIASVLALVSEDRKINQVFGELFSCRGNQIQLHRAADYINFDCATPTVDACCLSFWEISYLARAAGSIVLGYVRPDAPIDGGTGCDEQRVVMNPPDKDTLISWKPDDLIIVISKSHYARMMQEASASQRGPVNSQQLSGVSSTDVPSIRGDVGVGVAPGAYNPPASLTTPLVSDSPSPPPPPPSRRVGRNGQKLTFRGAQGVGTPLSKDHSRSAMVGTM